MQHDFKSPQLIWSSKRKSLPTSQVKPILLPRLSIAESQLKGSFISHKSLSSLEERTEYYSNLCSQYSQSNNKKIDIISEIKQRIARITARKSLADKQKPQKKKIFSKKSTINPNLAQISSPSFKVSQEILFEKPGKRKIIKS